MKKMLFFLGKGGVGKTTISSSAAYQLKKNGHKVLIVSLDPAHNLGDVFYYCLSNDKCEIEKNLDAMEIDLAVWVAKYLEKSRKEINETYRYNVSINLDSYMNILKYSPGTEEYAVLWAIEHIYEKFSSSYDFIIFDTPPTALTLRFLAMPSISKMWVQELSLMREAILKKRSTILKLNPDATVIHGASDKKDDAVHKKLGTIRASLDNLYRLFSKESYLTVVVNPDELSVAESLRIKSELEKLDVNIDSICLNKAAAKTGSDEKIKADFPGFPIFTASLIKEGLVSREDLGKVDIADLVEHISGKADE